MATSIGPRAAPARPAPARLLKAMKAILAPGLGLPPRADGAKASKRSHLSDRATCTGPGSRGRLRPERRLVLGFSWSLNCGVSHGPLTKAAHAPEGHISCASSRPSTADKKSAPRVPTHRARAAAELSTLSRARETRKRESTAAETPKTRRLRRASAHPPARDVAAGPPHRCGAGRTPRKQAHKKQRGQGRRRDE